MRRAGLSASAELLVCIDLMCIDLFVKVLRTLLAVLWVPDGGTLILLRI